MNDPENITEADKKRFFSKVEKLGTEAGCWIWTSSETSNKYGSFFIQKRARRAHRVSWSIHNGPIPSGMGILHRCDTPLCVRPDHLFLGTQKENALDCYAKGRSNLAPALAARRKVGWHRGSKNSFSKLTEKQVSEIRTLHLGRCTNLNATARKFGVCISLVSQIIKRKIWTHI